MTNKKQIFTEEELKSYLPLPHVQLHKICISLNNRDKTLDINMPINDSLYITFFNVNGLIVSNDFNYDICSSGNYIDIHEIDRLCDIIYDAKKLHFFIKIFKQDSAFIQRAVSIVKSFRIHNREAPCLTVF